MDDHHYHLGRALNRAVKTYDSSSVLQQEIGKHMIERLDWVLLKPNLILEIGCRTGYCTQLLEKRYPQATIVGVDLASAMLDQAQANSRCHFMLASPHALPFPDHSIDLIFSNFSLQQYPLKQTIIEWQRILKTDGLLMFSSVGPNTLQELAKSFAAVDQHPHVDRFMDMHNVGDNLMQAGFSDPVLDVENYTLTYTDVFALMKELKATGIQNIAADRARGLFGKNQLQHLLNAYEVFRNAEGKLPASVEVVYGQAWGAVKSARGNAKEAYIPVDSIIKS